jgi:hypothetical protein
MRTLLLLAGLMAANDTEDPMSTNSPGGATLNTVFLRYP